MNKWVDVPCHSCHHRPRCPTDYTGLAMIQSFDYMDLLEDHEVIL